MVAIQTKWLGPTDFRGSRVKAYTESGLSITVSWDHALNVEQNHTAAAMALAHKMDWEGKWVGGGLKTGYAFVCVERAWDASFHVKRPMKAVK